MNNLQNKKENDKHISDHPFEQPQNEAFYIWLCKKQETQFLRASALRKRGNQKLFEQL